MFMRDEFSLQLKSFVSDNLLYDLLKWYVEKAGVKEGSFMLGGAVIVSFLNGSLTCRADQIVESYNFFLTSQLFVTLDSPTTVINLRT